jgi:phage/plasmid-associated DNA primase
LRLASGSAWPQPSYHGDIVDELRSIQQPLVDFVAECCHCDPAFSVSKTDLFEAFRIWQKATDCPQMSRAVFFQQLRSTFPKLQYLRPRSTGEHRDRRIVGLQLTADYIGAID